MGCSPPGSSVHGFSQYEYWSGLPFPTPRDLPGPGIRPASPALAGRFFTTEPPGEPLYVLGYPKNQINECFSSSACLFSTSPWTLCRPVVCQPGCTSESPAELSKKKKKLPGPSPRFYWSAVVFQVSVKFFKKLSKQF